MLLFYCGCQEVVSLLCLYIVTFHQVNAARILVICFPLPLCSYVASLFWDEKKPCESFVPVCFFILLWFPGVVPTALLSNVTVVFVYHLDIFSSETIYFWFPYKKTLANNHIP